MAMEDWRKIRARLCNQNPRKDWSSAMIPAMSRPTSRLSKVRPRQNSPSDPDWISLPRSSSRASSLGDSFNSFRRRKLSSDNIDDILSKHPTTRPRSVSLVKYDPLPAINSESSKTRQFSPGEPEQQARSKADDQSLESKPNILETLSISPIKEHEIEILHLDSETDDSETENKSDETQTSATDETTVTEGFVKPKLVRSNTFEVIETNLTNLPVIGSTSESSSEEESFADADAVLANDQTGLKSKLEVNVNIDGVSLLTFLFQSTEDTPLSLLSLVTHPGSPDSGFAVESVTTFSGRSQRESDLCFVDNKVSNFSELQVTDTNAFCIEAGASNSDVDPLENTEYNFLNAVPENLENISELFREVPDNVEDVSELFNTMSDNPADASELVVEVPENPEDVRNFPLAEPDTSPSLNNPRMDAYEAENFVSVTFPDNTSTNVRFNMNATLRDFLASLQALKWQQNTFEIIEEIDEKYLEELFIKFHITNDTKVHLIPKA